jgi:glutaredoxin-related protein
MSLSTVFQLYLVVSVIGGCKIINNPTGVAGKRKTQP